MKKLIFIYLVLFTAAAMASQEILKGASLFVGVGGEKACQIIIKRDDNSKEITGIHIKSPAKVFSTEDGAAQAVTAMEGKTFSEFHFQKLMDLSGDGYMLVGEKNLKAQKATHRVYIHFGVKDGKVIALQLIGDIKNHAMLTLSSYRHACINLTN